MGSQRSTWRFASLLAAACVVILQAAPAAALCGRGKVDNKVCATPGHCCSKKGWCGRTEVQCAAANCAGGPCWPAPPPPPKSSSPPPPPVKQSPPPTRSPSPRPRPPPASTLPCGNGTVNSGICSDRTLCCSEHGWCDQGREFCGVNCKGGPCWGTVSPPPPRPPPRPNMGGLPDEYNGESISGCKNLTHMALTYDDGPRTFTTEVLANLKANNVTATFFLIGERVAANPDLARAIRDGGHMIAGHSNTHPDFKNITLGQMRAELTQADNTYTSVLGLKPRFFRYPFGSFNATTDAIVINQFDKVPIHWNVDTNDWRYATSDPARIFGDFPAMVNAAVAKGQGPLALFHPDLHKTSLDAMQQVFEWGKNNNYTFVTLDTCLGYTGANYV